MFAKDHVISYFPLYLSEIIIATRAMTLFLLATITATPADINDSARKQQSSIIKKKQHLGTIQKPHAVTCKSIKKIFFATKKIRMERLKCNKVVNPH